MNNEYSINFIDKNIQLKNKNYYLKSFLNYKIFLLISIFLLIKSNENDIKINQNTRNVEITESKNEYGKGLNKDSSLNVIFDITSHTMHKFYNSSKIIMILFIEPNCIKCNRFVKIFSELNQILSKENDDLKNVKLGVLNGFQDKKIVENFDIEEFPTILFLNQKFNTQEKITDLQRTKDLYDFLYKKIIKKWNFLENLNEVEKFNENKVNMVVCRNEVSELQKEFFDKLKEIIEKYENVNYYLINVMNVKSEIKKLEKEYQGKLKFFIFY